MRRRKKKEVGGGTRKHANPGREIRLTLNMWQGIGKFFTPVKGGTVEERKHPFSYSVVDPGKGESHGLGNVLFGELAEKRPHRVCGEGDAE